MAGARPLHWPPPGAVVNAYYELADPSSLSYRLKRPANSWHISAYVTADYGTCPFPELLFVLLLLKPVNSAGVADIPAQVIPTVLPHPSLLFGPFADKRPIFSPLAFDTFDYFVADEPFTTALHQLRLLQRGKFRPKAITFSDLGIAAAFEGKMPVCFNPKQVPSRTEEYNMELMDILEKYRSHHRLGINEKIIYSTRVRKEVRNEGGQMLQSQSGKYAEVLLCHACGRAGTRTHHHWPGLPTLKVCTGCKLARYCDETCQQQAWTIGKHRSLCKMYTNL